MKKRFLHLSLLLAITILGQTIAIADNGGHYVPRTQDAASAEQFLSSLRANQHTGLIDPAMMIKASQSNAKLDPVAPNDAMYWLSMGPDNMGGQTTAVLYDNQSNVIYIGSKGGGVFKSYNGGITWHQVGNQNLMVSCMTQAPNGTIYVGTGDASPALTYNGLEQYGFSGDSFVGTGLYTLDANDNLTQIVSTNPANDETWSYINEISLSGSNLLVATPQGLMCSADNGTSWVAIDFYKNDGESLENVANVTGVKLLGNDKIVAAMGGKIYIGTVEGLVCHSTNNAQIGYNEENEIDRIPKAAGLLDLATLDGNSQLIYAVCIASNGNHKGMFVSKNGGDTWKMIYPEVASSPNYGHQVYGGFGLYNHGVVISPTNEDLIFILGYDLWKIEKLNEEGYFVANCLSAGGTAPITSPNYIHVGIHDLKFNPKKTNEFVVGTNGGVFKGVYSSTGISTSNCNRNYITTRMMDVAVSGVDTKVMASGLDHGTVYIPGIAGTDTPGHASWINPSGHIQGVFAEAAQGGTSAFSILNSNTIFISYKNSNIARSSTLGQDWISLNFTSALSIADANKLFYTPFALYEDVNDVTSEATLWFKNTTGQTMPAGTTIQCMSINDYPFDYVLQNALANNDSIEIQDVVTSKLYMAAKNTIYRTATPLQFSVEAAWSTISTRNVGTPICMSLSSDGDVMFVGTLEGKLYRAKGLKDVVSDTLFTVAENNRAITSVAIDPNDANKIVVTLGNYGNDNYVYYCDNALDAAPTFTSKQGNLPKMPVFSSIIEMTTGDVIIGTEHGIYKTSDIANPNWVKDAENMGDVPVMTLKQQTMTLEDRMVVKASEEDTLVTVYPGVHNTGIIYAATYGRGVFRCENYKLSNVNVAENTLTAEMNVSMYPNPVRDHAMVSFEVMGNKNVSYQVFDLTGRVVMSAKMGSYNDGKHEFGLDMSSLKAGNYILRLEQGAEVSTVKFVVY